MSTPEQAKILYDRIQIYLKKGNKQEISEHLKEFPYKSVNDFIGRAIDEKIEHDKQETAGE